MASTGDSQSQLEKLSRLNAFEEIQLSEYSLQQTIKESATKVGEHTISCIDLGRSNILFYKV